MSSVNGNSKDADGFKAGRTFILPKDVMNITGLKYRPSCKLLNEVRKQFGKRARQLVTVMEFCQHSGYPEAFAFRRMNG